MGNKKLSNQDIRLLIKNGIKLPFAIENYPSRGQTAVQELYLTGQGKLFLKRVSERNHEECRIDVNSGSLAEREYWSYCVAKEVGLFVPELWLLDESTTVQRWLDYPDGNSFKRSTGKMEFVVRNVFECAAFDWLTGQVDRHDANYLYNYRDKQVIPVDSAHAFLTHEGAIPDYLHLFEVGDARRLKVRVRSDAKDRIDGMSADVLAQIVPLRDAREKDALASRKDKLKKIHALDGIIKLYRSR